MTGELARLESTVGDIYLTTRSNIRRYYKISILTFVRTTHSNVSLRPGCKYKAQA